MPEIPATPQEVNTVLWIIIVVTIPALCGVVIYLWRSYQKLRDQREKDFKDLLAKEKAESEKQQALLDRNTDTLDSILQELIKRGATVELPHKTAEPAKKGTK